MLQAANQRLPSCCFTRIRAYIKTGWLSALLLMPLISVAEELTGPFRMEAVVDNPPAPEIGKAVSLFTFFDTNGKASQLDNDPGIIATVIAVRDTTCPVSQKYGPATARMEQAFAARGVRFLYLNLNPNDAISDMRREIERFGFTGRYIVDRNQQIGVLLDVRSTADVFVLDGQLRLAYRGAIDDQYGIGFARETASRHYLKDALQAVLAGSQPAIASTLAPGCFLKPGLPSKAGSDLVWYRDIESIVQTHCQECHRPGEIGPFPLLSYTDVAGRKEMIRFVLQNRIMPPWFAAPGSGPWTNNLQLSDTDRAVLLSWIDAGAPAGNPQDGPPPRQWINGWRNGEPDAVLQIPEPIHLPAEGVIEYFYATIKTDFDEDKWIQGFEVRTNVPRSAHHILMFLDRPETDDSELFEEEGMASDVQMPGGWALDGFFAGTIVGAGGIRYPDGMAKRLPKGAQLRVQLHYTASGVAAVDQPVIGLKFADEPPRQEIRTLAASKFMFSIPAHAPNHAIKASYKLEEDGIIIGYLPHMHLRGKAFRYVLERPDGSRKTLLEVPRYDPNWQLLYQLESPLVIENGSVLHATGWYDNSADNPANPNPNHSVGFGLQVWDEMMIGYFDWVTANPDHRAAKSASILP